MNVKTPPSVSGRRDGETHEHERDQSPQAAVRRPGRERAGEQVGEAVHTHVPDTEPGFQRTKRPFPGSKRNAISLPGQQNGGEAPGPRGGGVPHSGQQSDISRSFLIDSEKTGGEATREGVQACVTQGVAPSPHCSSGATTSNQRG